MQVYEKRPSGLSVRDLRSYAARAPRHAAFAAMRLVVGLALVACIVFPLGFLWFLLGLVSLASVFLFVREAATAAIVRPALVLTGLPKWDGTRRTSWVVDADDPLVHGEALAAALDDELGASLTAFDEGADFRGTTRAEVFGGAGDLPAIIAWGVGRKPRLAATADVDGVWMRVDPGADGAAPAVTLLANTGTAVDALKQVAWRSGRS
ncbi:MAG: hypothetical protein U0Q22_09780 [Acidimicrobiales bacterium]